MAMLFFCQLISAVLRGLTHLASKTVFLSSVAETGCFFRFDKRTYSNVPLICAPLQHLRPPVSILTYLFFQVLD